MSELSPNFPQIAVSAASGRLGHAVLVALARDVGPSQLVAVARAPERVFVPGVAKRAGDYASVESMTRALDGIRALVMISAPVVDGTDRLALHRNVIEAARRAGTGTVIFTSVIGSDAAKQTLFAPSHDLNRQTEAALESSGLGWIIARNGLYMELDVAHIVRAGPDGVYANPAGEGRAPYITIGEIAYALARLAAAPAAHRGRVYNIVGELATQRELVGLVNEVAGLAVRYEAISDEENIARFRRLMPERGEAVARMLTGCFQCMRIGAFEVFSDFETAAGRPAKSLREMMQDCLSARAPAGSPQAPAGLRPPPG